jgi:predicted negative regulator of RcsB-dependent stress response
MPLVLDETLQCVQIKLDNINIQQQMVNNKIVKLIFWILLICLFILLFTFVMYVRHNTKKETTNNDELRNIVESIQRNKLNSSKILNSYIVGKK